ncbi:hypothetical protein A0H81_10854 [Grifola frondosa]|uniref:Uncharacterized protein n=1 Tax=Grifola frondosa TaxID=5627 RepID=A0A1C7LY75_GRIFR|nr:hypothetical protein A0H81_10854 [Grifola frondosa]
MSLFWKKSFQEDRKILVTEPKYSLMRKRSKKIWNPNIMQTFGYSRSDPIYAFLVQQIMPGETVEVLAVALRGSQKIPFSERLCRSTLSGGASEWWNASIHQNGRYSSSIEGLDETEEHVDSSTYYASESRTAGDSSSWLPSSAQGSLTREEFLAWKTMPLMVDFSFIHSQSTEPFSVKTLFHLQPHKYVASIPNLKSCLNPDNNPTALINGTQRLGPNVSYNIDLNDLSTGWRRYTLHNVRAGGHNFH